jgi:agmatinase
LPLNFLGLPPELATYESSRVAILPIAYDSTTSYRAGSREAPAAIIQASRFQEYYDPELRKDFTRVGIATLPILSPVMSGPKQMIRKVYQAARRILKDQKFLMMLGGEHSLTVGMVQAFHEHFPEMGVLQIDAHLDLREEYDSTPFDHACAMRRTLEICPIVQVGIRSVSEEEDTFVQTKNLRPYYAWEIKKDPEWTRKAAQELPQDVYITVDLDGLDPSIMPAVGTPEPNGLLWHEVMELLNLVARSHRIIGGDVVELCPIPGFISPDYLASKLVSRIIALATVT